MFFPVITKNLKWEFLTKNLVTFKRWDRVKMKFLGGELTKNQYMGGNCLKRGAWTVCRLNGGFGKKEGGDVFERGGVDTPNKHYGITSFLLKHCLKKQ